MNKENLLPNRCQYLNKFVWKPHKYWVLLTLLYQGNPLYPLKASFFILTNSRIFLGLPQKTTFLLSSWLSLKPSIFKVLGCKKTSQRIYFFLYKVFVFSCFIHLSLGYSFLPLEDNRECPGITSPYSNSLCPRLHLTYFS